jgi:modulator of FtsH protease
MPIRAPITVGNNDTPQNNFDNVSRFQSQSTSLATHKVLSQSYALLGVSLFPTVIGALMGMTMNWGWAAGLGIMFPILMIAGLFGMFYLIRANRNSSLGVVFLMILTFLMGLLLGPILQMAFSFSNGGQIVSLAAGGTGSIFLALSFSN